MKNGVTAKFNFVKHFNSFGLKTIETKTVSGIEISKLTLGTVALGIDYGIANRQGKPSLQHSFEIIGAALKSGINTLDTARSYGTAEDVIGSYLINNSNAGKPVICSKFKISRSALSNKALAFREIESSVEESLRRLNLAQLPICLFHMDRRLPLQRVLSIVPEILQELRKDGLISMAGVSVDHPSEVETFLEHPVMEAFQVPVNIFDHRLLQNGMLRRLKEGSKVVFARSVFLQGLFFLDPGHLQGNIKLASASLDKLKSFAERTGMTLPQFAFSFVRDLDGITSILFGAEKVEQVVQNIQLMQGEEIPPGIREEIYASFGNISESIITPALWAC